MLYKKILPLIKVYCWLAVGSLLLLLLLEPWDLVHFLGLITWSIALSYFYKWHKKHDLVGFLAGMGILGTFGDWMGFLSVIDLIFLVGVIYVVRQFKKYGMV